MNKESKLEQAAKEAYQYLDNSDNDIAIREWNQRMYDKREAFITGAKSDAAKEYWQSKPEQEGFYCWHSEATGDPPCKEQCKDCKGCKAIPTPASHAVESGIKYPQEIMDGYKGFDFNEAFTDNELDHISNAMFLYGKQFTATPSAGEGDAGRCCVCGGVNVFIRGKYPGMDKRSICPTCTQERLEQINEISSPHYGKASNSPK